MCVFHKKKNLFHWKLAKFHLKLSKYKLFLRMIFLTEQFFCINMLLLCQKLTKFGTKSQSMNFPRSSCFINECLFYLFIYFYYK